MGAIMGTQGRLRARTGGKFTVTIPNSRPAWAFLTLVGWVLGTQAAAGDTPQQCAAIGDDAERLACYDGIFRAPEGAAVTGAASTTIAPAAWTGVAAQAATAAAPAAAAAVPAVAASAPAMATPQDDFGLTEAAKRAREPEGSRERLPESISDTVAKVGWQPAGEFVVTLENGQVWTQLEVDPRARVAAGDTVTIKKAALGSHLLVTANRYATRVRRVK